MSLQPDKDIQKCFQSGTGYGYPKRFPRYCDDSDSRKSCTWKHRFSLLYHDSKSVYGEISVPLCNPLPYWLKTLSSFLSMILLMV